MCIHFLCLYPLILAIMLNFNISKVAYCILLLLTANYSYLEDN